MKKRVLRSARFILLLTLISGACTWSPKVIHPGLGNAGIAMAPKERTEIGFSTWAGVVPSFARAELRVFEMLTISGGYGLTGPDNTGFLASLNLVVINSSNGYLVISPNIVTHDNNEHGFSGISLGGTLTGGLKINKAGTMRVYGNIFAGQYRGEYNSQNERGLLLTPGVGFDTDFGLIRIFLEGNLPIQQSVDTTLVLPNLSAGLTMGF